MDNAKTKDTRLNVRIEEELRERFYEKCKKEYKKPAQKIRDMLYDYIKKDD